LVYFLAFLVLRLIGVTLSASACSIGASTIAATAASSATDGSFDLVVLANMIPFFDELARVVAPDGRVVFSFSAGPETPIWVPPERLRRELGVRGFSDFADFAAAGGTALLARRGEGV